MDPESAHSRHQTRHWTRGRSRGHPLKIKSKDKAVPVSKHPHHESVWGTGGKDPCIINCSSQPHADDVSDSSSCHIIPKKERPKSFGYDPFTSDCTIHPPDALRCPHVCFPTSEWPHTIKTLFAIPVYPKPCSASQPPTFRYLSNTVRPS